MPRSLKKGPFVDDGLMRKVVRSQESRDHRMIVITSYSIHYTKLYEVIPTNSGIMVERRDQVLIIR